LFVQTPDIIIVVVVVVVVVVNYIC